MSGIAQPHSQWLRRRIPAPSRREVEVEDESGFLSRQCQTLVPCTPYPLCGMRIRIWGLESYRCSNSERAVRRSSHGSGLRAIWDVAVMSFRATNLSKVKHVRSPPALTSCSCPRACTDRLPRAFGADSLTYDVSGIAGPAVAGTLPPSGVAPGPT